MAFDLLGARHDPERLMERLEAFIERWCGPRDRLYGVSEEALQEVTLPGPLRRLYAYAGEWPGLLNHDDRLAPLWFLREHAGKLEFLEECQGVWTCATERTGDDPPVWVRLDEETWLPLDASLSQFLVTYCLREITLGGPFLVKSRGLVAKFKQAGKMPVPLWLRGPYNCLDERIEVDFHLVDGRIIMMDGEWAATDSPEARDWLLEFCRNDRWTEYERDPWTGEISRLDESAVLIKDASASRPRGGWSVDDPVVPRWIAAATVEAAAIRHEQIAARHAELANRFREIAAERRAHYEAGDR